jgi:hypothetical protein
MDRIGVFARIRSLPPLPSSIAFIVFSVTCYYLVRDEPLIRHISNDVPQSNTSFRAELASIERVCAALSQELESKDQYEEPNGIGIENVLTSHIMRTKIAHSVMKENSPSLEMSLVRYGRDRKVQLLGIASHLRRNGTSGRLCVLIALTEPGDDYHLAIGEMTRHLSGPWTSSDINSVRTAINSGLRGPATEVCAANISESIPLEVSISLLIEDPRSVYRFAEWDAVFLGRINSALADGELSKLFAQKNDVSTIAHQMLHMPSGARYAAVWYLADCISDEECVSYLDLDSESLSDVQLFSIVRRMEDVGRTLGIKVNEEGVRWRQRVFEAER